MWLATAAFVKSDMFDKGITLPKVKKLSALQCAIGSKIQSQRALELLGQGTPGVQINQQFIIREGLEVLAKLKAARPISAQASTVTSDGKSDAPPTEPTT